MDLTLMIVALVALAAFIMLMIYAIFSISSIRKLIVEGIYSLQLINKDFSELKIKMIETLTNVDETIKQISVTTKNIEEEANTVLSMFKPFHMLIDILYSKVAPPLMQAATVISATSKAVNVFANILTLGKKKN